MMNADTDTDIRDIVHGAQWTKRDSLIVSRSMARAQEGLRLDVPGTLYFSKR
jgi:hypothetical protein